jgi:mRNA interferase RelE/StbE
VSSYTVYVQAGAWHEIKGLPGNVRQRVRQAIDNLAEEPRPAASKTLEVEEDLPELRRIRLDRWRIIYSIDEDSRAIDILAVRRRPPYDYGDLAGLTSALR